MASHSTAQWAASVAAAAGGGQCAAAVYHGADELVVAAADTAECAMRSLAQWVIDADGRNASVAGDRLERTMHSAQAGASASAIAHDEHRATAVEHAADRGDEQWQRRRGPLPHGCFLSEANMDTDAAERHVPRASHIGRMRTGTGTGPPHTATTQEDGVGRAKLSATARCDACGESDFDIEVSVQLRAKAAGGGAMAAALRPVLRPSTIHFNERLVWHCAMETKADGDRGDYATATQTERKVVLSAPASDTSSLTGDIGGGAETHAKDKQGDNAQAYVRWERLVVDRRPRGIFDFPPPPEADPVVYKAFMDNVMSDFSKNMEGIRKRVAHPPSQSTQPSETAVPPAEHIDADKEGGTAVEHVQHKEQGAEPTAQHTEPSGTTIDSQSHTVVPTSGTGSTEPSTLPPTSDTAAADSTGSTHGTLTAGTSESSTSVSVRAAGADAVETRSSIERWHADDVDDMHTARSGDSDEPTAVAEHTGGGKAPTAATAGHKESAEKPAAGDNDHKDTGVEPDE